MTALIPLAPSHRAGPPARRKTRQRLRCGSLKLMRCRRLFQALYWTIYWLLERCRLAAHCLQGRVRSCDKMCCDVLSCDIKSYVVLSCSCLFMSFSVLFLSYSVLSVLVPQCALSCPVSRFVPGADPEGSGCLTLVCALIQSASGIPWSAAEDWCPVGHKLS